MAPPPRALRRMAGLGFHIQVQHPGACGRFPQARRGQVLRRFFVPPGGGFPPSGARSRRRPKEGANHHYQGSAQLASTAALPSAAGTVGASLAVSSSKRDTRERRTPSAKRVVGAIWLTTNSSNEIYKTVLHVVAPRAVRSTPRNQAPIMPRTVRSQSGCARQAEPRSTPGGGSWQRYDANGLRPRSRL